MHYPVQCPVPLEKKLQQINFEKRCVCCLSMRHLKNCINNRPCRCCGGSHHTALCRKKSNDKPASNPTSAAAVTLAVSAPMFGNVFLMTGSILIKGTRGTRRAICLLDSGSHRTFIRKDLADDLGLEITGSEDLSIQAFGTLRPEISQRRQKMFKFSRNYEINIFSTFY